MDAPTTPQHVKAWLELHVMNSHIVCQDNPADNDADIAWLSDQLRNPQSAPCTLSGQLGTPTPAEAACNSPGTCNCRLNPFKALCSEAVTPGAPVSPTHETTGQQQLPSRLPLNILAVHPKLATARCQCSSHSSDKCLRARYPSASSVEISSDSDSGVMQHTDESVAYSLQVLQAASNPQPAVSLHAGPGCSLPHTSATTPSWQLPLMNCVSDQEPVASAHQQASLQAGQGPDQLLSIPNWPATLCHQHEYPSLTSAAYAALGSTAGFPRVAGRGGSLAGQGCCRKHHRKTAAAAAATICTFPIAKPRPPGNPSR